MKGAPNHCGMPMRVIGGYQCNGTDSWARWACNSCEHVETIYGTIEGDARDPVWKPRESKLPMVVLMCTVPNGVLCRGISQDQTVFNNRLYANASVAIDLIGRHFPLYRIHFNLPKENA